MSKFVTSYEFDEKQEKIPKLVAQSKPTLYYSQQLSSTCNFAINPLTAIPVKPQAAQAHGCV